MAQSSKATRQELFRAMVAELTQPPVSLQVMAHGTDWVGLVLVQPCSVLLLMKHVAFSKGKRVSNQSETDKGQ